MKQIKQKNISRLISTRQSNIFSQSNILKKYNVFQADNFLNFFFKKEERAYTLNAHYFQNKQRTSNHIIIGIQEKLFL